MDGSHNSRFADYLFGRGWRKLVVSLAGAQRRQFGKLVAPIDDLVDFRDGDLLVDVLLWVVHYSPRKT